MRIHVNILKLSLVFLTVFCNPAVAKTFKRISVKGLKKTSHSVFLNELQIYTGKNYSDSDIEKARQRLLDTNLFSSVAYNIVGSRLLLTVSEKWTTIPILKFSSSGDVQETTVGIYDPNVLGQFIELGAQGTRLGETTSGALWFRNPRLFGSKNTLDIQLWKQNRLRTKYDQDSEEPIPVEGFLHKRDKIFLGYTHVLSPSFFLSGIYEYNKDSFSDEVLPDDVPFAPNLPSSSEYHFAGLGIKFLKEQAAGSANNFQARLDLRYGLSADRDLKNFWIANAEINYRKTVFSNHQIAFRFMTGLTDTKVLQFWHYLGGLDRIRGFEDNRFAGRYFWLSNAEYRAPLFRNENYIFMGTLFSDIATVSENTTELSDISGASVGIGVRLILPKIYRFVLRLDYARPVISRSDDENAISFGVQHFF